MGAGAGVTFGSPGSSSQVGTSFFWVLFVVVAAAVDAFLRGVRVLRGVFLPMCASSCAAVIRVYAQSGRGRAQMPVQLLASTTRVGQACFVSRRRVRLQPDATGVCRKRLQGERAA